MNRASTFDELIKLGAISDEQAQAALNRLTTLERNKPTPGRVARYAAVGAVAAPVIHAATSAIEGKNPLKGLSHLGKLRHAGAHAAKGALAAGAVPLVQQHFDRRGEEKTLHKYLAERTKAASTRYEREISAGNISRPDISPSLPNVREGVLGRVGRKLTRDQLAAPAERTPEAVDKTRALNARQFTAQSKRPDAIAQGVKADVHPSFIAGAGAGTMPGGPPQVFAPDSGGQLVRGLGGGFRDRMKATLGIAQGKPTLLPPRAPVDATLNKAVLHHELGEAAELGKGTVRPFASHLGTDPIIRENLGAQGDPEAVAHMAKIRQLHPDDALVQKAIRQAGGTPDAPIPLGGAQHRAVDRILDRSGGKLQPATRMGALVRKATLGKEIGYLPPHVSRTLSTGTGIMEQLSNERVTGVRDAISRFKALYPSGKTLLNYVREGT